MSELLDLMDKIATKAEALRAIHDILIEDLAREIKKIKIVKE
jgi:hypothetical protein